MDKGRPFLPGHFLTQQILQKCVAVFLGIRAVSPLLHPVGGKAPHHAASLSSGYLRFQLIALLGGFHDLLFFRIQAANLRLQRVDVYAVVFQLVGNSRHAIFDFLDSVHLITSNNSFNF